MQGREKWILRLSVSESDSSRSVSGLRIPEVLPKAPSTAGVTVPATEAAAAVPEHHV